MNSWLAAGYIAFFVLLAGYLLRLAGLERTNRRERERLTAAETRSERT